MPYLTDGTQTDYVCLTDEAAEEIHDVLARYENCANLSKFKGQKSDFFSFAPMLPDDVRQLADDLYPILTDKSNLELNTDNLELNLSDINSLEEKVDE